MEKTMPLRLQGKVQLKTAAKSADLLSADFAAVQNFLEETLGSTVAIQ